MMINTLVPPSSELLFRLSILFHEPELLSIWLRHSRGEGYKLRCCRSGMSQDLVLQPSENDALITLIQAYRNDLDKVAIRLAVRLKSSLDPVFLRDGGVGSIWGTPDGKDLRFFWKKLPPLHGRKK